MMSGRKPLLAILMPCLLGIAACGGGGGSGSAISTGGVSGTGSTGSTGTTSNFSVYIEPINAAFITTQTLVIPGTPTSFPVASASTPNLSTSTPPVGTVFPLEQIALSIDTKIGGVGSPGVNSGVQLTYTGTQTVNGAATPLFEMTIPDYHVDVQGLNPNGTSMTLPDGRTVVLAMTSLNYSLYAGWAISPFLVGSNANSIGIGISGYQTPSNAVPTSGSATYLGNNTAGAPGGVQGTVLSSSGSVLSAAAITGSASVNVNFASGAVAGSLTNMTATPTGGTASAWNTINLSGTLSGSAISGTTSTSASVSGTYGLSAGSTGTVRGALFGPNGQELGLVWAINDPTQVNFGRSALGFVGATKQ